MSIEGKLEGGTTLALAGEMDLVNLELFGGIGDVQVTLSAELDHRTISVHELMRLEVDQIISLSRPAGENVDLFVGDVLIGNAEILVVDEKLAVRVADLKDKPPTIHNPAPPQ